MKLAYSLDGPQHAPVLVLSGALGTTMALWEPQLRAFAADLRVLRHDLPGHGSSPLPETPVEIAGIAHAILSLLDALGIAQVAFCGVSLGGMVGMWLGANAPHRTQKLVLACTGASLGTPELYSERAALVRAHGTRAVVDGARDRWFTPAFRDSPAARRILEDLAGIPPEGYAACCEAVGAFDFHDELVRIAAPTLVVYGQADPTTPPDVIDELVREIPRARPAAIPHAAHLANVEQPDLFAAAVLRHLDERVAA